MTADVYKLTTLNLFEDLKHTNIKNEDFKQIISSYQKLANAYIKENQADLFKDLNKQKEVIFSYLPSLKQQSIKKVACLHKKLESELGEIDEIDTFQSPEKQVQFIKVAYDDGKWTITANNFDNAEFTKKETPEAINCLVNLVDRLDEQEAAYALCHARKAGLFTMAALPYVRTEDFTNTALEPRFVKDPGTVLGPIEHSWESSTDNTNMPVSRQIASETDDIQEMDTFVDKDGDNITISTISGDAVITFDNDIYTKEEVEENIQSGYWTKVEAADDNIKVKKVQRQLSEITEGAIREEQIELEANRRLIQEYQEKLDNLQKSKLEEVRKMSEPLKAKAQKYASKLDALTLENGKVERKLQRMKFDAESGVQVRHSLPVENFKTQMVSVKEAQEVLDLLYHRYGKKNAKLFQELNESLFKQVDAAEQFSLGLSSTQENEKDINQRMDFYRKKMQSSKNDVFAKNAAYDQLDNMLIDGYINFNQYSKLCDFAETDARTTLMAIKDIKASLDKSINSGVISDLKDKFLGWIDSAKSWFTKTISFITLLEKETKDINDKLDTFIQEGE